MSELAMSSTTSWNGMCWEPLIYKLDEWLIYESELDKKEVNDSSLKLTKHEIAEQVLHNIEDLEKNITNDWLDDFSMLDDIQTLGTSEDVKDFEDCSNYNVKSEQEQLSPNDNSAASEIQLQPSISQDLLSVSYESPATFMLSNENILYVNNQAFVNITPLKPKRPTTPAINEEKPSWKGEDIKRAKEDGIPWTEIDSSGLNLEMAVVDEIIRNTALELDQWESDSSRSETSSEGASALDMSPKEREEETDDPDWKPVSLATRVRKCYIRAGKPCRKIGNQEEKRLRKKEQNKNAATRYRQKKKAEVYEILREENCLKEKKAKLEEKVADIQGEIKCLKALMRDLFKAKGIIN